MQHMFFSWWIDFRLKVLPFAGLWTLVNDKCGMSFYNDHPFFFYPLKVEMNSFLNDHIFDLKVAIGKEN